MARTETERSSAEGVLKLLGIVLPPAPRSLGSYRQWRRVGNLLFVAGQAPMRDGNVVHSGLVGRDVTLEDGVAAARLCTINALAVAKDAVGSLDKIRGVVRALVFVACDSTFTEHPRVGNGATDLLEQLWGEDGAPARAAVGAPSLPKGISVEVELQFEIA